MTVHIPRWVLVLALDLVAVVCGWLLYGSIDQVVGAAAAPTAPVAQLAPPVAVDAAPPVPAPHPLASASTQVTTPARAVAIATAPAATDPARPAVTSHVTTPGAVVALAAEPTGAAAPPGGAAPSAPFAPAAPGSTAPAPPAAPTTPIALPAAAAPAVPSPTTPPPVAPALAALPASMTNLEIAMGALPQPLAIRVPTGPGVDTTPMVGPTWVQGPGSYIDAVLAPRPDAASRGVAFSEWESYRTDIAGRNIVATTDDSNVFIKRNGQLNGNTGDTDASGLNVTAARNAVIRGSESADEAPWQTAAATLVELATGERPDGPLSDEDDDDDDDDDGDANDPDPGANGTNPFPYAVGARTTAPRAGGDDAAELDDDADDDEGDDADAPRAERPAATAAVITPTGDDDDDDDDEDEFDFPYTEWTQQVSADTATAVHTDEGTTLASGQDAIVVGGDGYDDDNRAVGEHLVVTRDDSHVVIGGTGNVNAQVGDSEQGAVIMDVDNVFIQGGGAY